MPLQDRGASGAGTNLSGAGCDFVKPKQRTWALAVLEVENQPMANNKEEAGKGTQWPGEMPASKRPYATIDLTASEVDTGGRTAPSPTPAVAAESGAGPKFETSSSPDPAGTAEPALAGGPGTTEGGAGSPETPAPAAARWRSTPFIGHFAAGALGALVVLLAFQFLAPTRPSSPAEMGDLARRVADLENALGTRPGAGLRARIDEQARALGALGDTQAKLARETKALETRLAGTPVVTPELLSRIAKLEDTLNAASTAEPTALSPQITALAARVAEIEKAAKQGSEAARAGVGRLDGELSQLRTEAGRLTQRLDTLKGEIEERLRGAAKAADLGPLAAKLAALEASAQSFIRSEADRAAGAAQMLLALELTGLKRAIDRGEGYAEELARVKKLAGTTVNMAPLERYMREGAPPVTELVKSFRKVANDMLDAEAETADASLLDRLLSGARSVVRVRKVGHPSDDTSAEAVIGRMETALKEGRLADVLEQAKKLPPKAALAGEEWIGKLEARHTIDKAIADAEAAIKNALAPAKAAAPEARQ